MLTSITSDVIERSSRFRLHPLGSGREISHLSDHYKYQSLHPEITLKALEEYRNLREQGDGRSCIVRKVALPT
ncbi:hypothetical protein R3I94_017383 [Phoxinus phoxinus]|uniref:Uncharacterized protein n=1 Tax=Phoxinus phoxinus TaxID=58324 RepID=A0AAN9CF36_9TELE